MITWSIVDHKCLLIWCRKKLSCGDDPVTFAFAQLVLALLHFLFDIMAMALTKFCKDQCIKNILLNRSVKNGDKTNILIHKFSSFSTCTHPSATSGRNKATFLKADRRGRAIMPRHDAKNNHISCVSSLSLCSHLSRAKEHHNQPKPLQLWRLRSHFTQFRSSTQLCSRWLSPGLRRQFLSSSLTAARIVRE